MLREIEVFLQLETKDKVSQRSASKNRPNLGGGKLTFAVYEMVVDVPAIFGDN
jgi:hypothetical protein